MARVGIIVARVVHHQPRIAKIPLLRHLNFETQREHCGAEITVLARRTGGQKVHGIQPLARTEVEDDPFDRIGTRSQFAAVAVDRGQRPVGRVREHRIADPLRGPIVRREQSHAP